MNEDQEKMSWLQIRITVLWADWSRDTDNDEQIINADCLKLNTPHHKRSADFFPLPASFATEYYEVILTFDYKSWTCNLLLKTLKSIFHHEYCSSMYCPDTINRLCLTSTYCIAGAYKDAFSSLNWVPDVKIDCPTPLTLNVGPS